MLNHTFQKTVQPAMHIYSQQIKCQYHITPKGPTLAKKSYSHKSLTFTSAINYGGETITKKWGIYMYMKEATTQKTNTHEENTGVEQKKSQAS